MSFVLFYTYFPHFRVLVLAKALAPNKQVITRQIGCSDFAQNINLGLQALARFVVILSCKQVGRNSGLAYSAEHFHFSMRRNTRQSRYCSLRMRLSGLKVQAIEPIIKMAIMIKMRQPHPACIVSPNDLPPAIAPKNTTIKKTITKNSI